MKTSAEDRLKGNSKISSTNSYNDVPCKEWTGDTFPYCGYGRVSFNSKNIRVHRLAWMLANPTDILTSTDFIMHQCNNKLCIEISHLEKGNHKLNMQYMTRCGRSGPRGPKKGHKKRPMQTRVAIVKARLLGSTALQLATQYNIPFVTIKGYCRNPKIKALAQEELNSIGQGI